MRYNCYGCAVTGRRVKESEIRRGTCHGIIIYSALADLVIVAFVTVAVSIAVVPVAVATPIVFFVTCCERCLEVRLDGDFILFDVVAICGLDEVSFRLELAGVD